MDKRIQDVKNAVANLKLVALNLHVPLDALLAEAAPKKVGPANL